MITDDGSPYAPPSMELPETDTKNEDVNLRPLLLLLLFAAIPPVASLIGAILCDDSSWRSAVSWTYLSFFQATGLGVFFLIFSIAIWLSGARPIHRLLMIALVAGVYLVAAALGWYIAGISYFIEPW